MIEKEKGRRLLLGGGGLVAILVVVGIAAAIQYIILQHPKRWDLTSPGLYTLAPQSKKVLATFREKRIPVNVLAFLTSEHSALRDRLTDLLNQYRDLYPKFTFSFVDPDSEKAVAMKHKVEVFPTLLFQVQDRQEQVTLGHEAAVSEESVTNALVRLLRTETKKVYLLKGHDELSPDSPEPTGMSWAKSQIEKQNCKVEELVLMAADKAPDDATMLIIAGPKGELSDRELEMLKGYVERGGKLLVLIHPFSSRKLCDFLKNYAIETSDDIIFEAGKYLNVAGGNFAPLVTDYRLPFLKEFRQASCFPVVRSVRVSQKPVPNVTAKELAFTTEKSWTISHRRFSEGLYSPNPGESRMGPIPIIAVSTYTNLAALAKHFDKKQSGDSSGSEELPGAKGDKPDQADEESGASSIGKPPKGRILVIGSSEFATNQLLKIAGNFNLFINTVSWLAEEENLIAIRPRSIKSDPVHLEKEHLEAVFIILTVIVPVLWFAGGIAVFMYRRKSATIP